MPLHALGEENEGGAGEDEAEGFEDVVQSDSQEGQACDFKQARTGDNHRVDDSSESLHDSEPTTGFGLLVQRQHSASQPSGRVTGLVCVDGQPE